MIYMQKNFIFIVWQKSVGLGEAKDQIMRIYYLQKVKLKNYKLAKD